MLGPKDYKRGHGDSWLRPVDVRVLRWSKMLYTEKCYILVAERSVAVVSFDSFFGMSADEVTGNDSSGIMNCVSLPRPFDEGNFGEWLLRFEICSGANNWNDEVKARRLPTLLEGETFLAYQRLSDDVRRNYGRLTTELKNNLQPPCSARAAFVQFKNMRWRTGESVRTFVHRLTQALNLAVPGLDARSRDRLLLRSAFCQLCQNCIAVKCYFKEKLTLLIKRFRRRRYYCLCASRPIGGAREGPPAKHCL
ncbi:hypothetical protein TTRE_0000646201 [Trichuris trichiura]|uniref:Uncharacterized protein n=1 Tax=Trichuris trichiura TaxID=36087 RepID=A0A077ZCS6_TRITR|nr:hypothetical protein TTRE_0000646201 [Trichuris trichiura]